MAPTKELVYWGTLEKAGRDRLSVGEASLEGKAREMLRDWTACHSLFPVAIWIIIDRDET